MNDNALYSARNLRAPPHSSKSASVLVADVGEDLPTENISTRESVNPPRIVTRCRLHGHENERVPQAFAKASVVPQDHSMTRRRLVTIAAVLSIIVAGYAVLYAVRSQVRPTSVSQTTRPTSSATQTAVMIAASTSPSPAPTPVGFALPEGCSYVSKPVVTQPGPVTTWEFTCGEPNPDLNAVERLTPAFAQQGWTSCRSSSGGHGVWAKGTAQTMVNQSAAGYPTLSQIERQGQDCP